MLIAGFAVVAALIIGVAIWAWQQQARSIRSQAEENLVAVSELKASQVSAWLEERRSDAEVITGDVLLARSAGEVVAGDAAASTRAAVESRLDDIRRAYDYLDVVLLAPDGSVVLRVPPSEHHPLGARGEDLAARAVETRQVAVSDLYLDERGDQRIEWAAPLLPDGPGGAVSGVVLLHSDPDRYLYPLIKEWPIPSESGETLLVERRGDEVVFLNDLRHRSDTALRLTTPLTEAQMPAVQAVLGAEGVVTGEDYRGVPVLGAVHRVHGSDWYAVAKIDSAEVLGPIARRGWATAALALALVACAAALTLLVWRARETRLAAEREEQDVRFRSLFENMGEGVALHELTRAEDGTAADYRITQVNPAFEQQTGVSAAAAEGRAATEAYGVPDAPYLAAYAEAVTAGERRRFECEFEPLQRHFQVSVVPQGGDRFATIFEDVTERVVRERELREAQARLAFALERSHTGGWDLDLLDHTALRTLEHDRIFGYEDLLPEWTYEMFLGHVLPEDRSEVDRLFQEAVAQRKDWAFECRIRRVDGEERWIRAVGGHQLGPDGEPRRMAGIVQDVTEARLAQERLAASEERFRYVFENALVGMSMTRPTGEVEVNTAFCRMLGYTREELAGARWQDITPPEDVPAIEALLAPLVGGDTDQARFVKRYLRKDGDIVWADVSVTLRRDEEGKPLHFITAVLDITKRKLAEEEVRRLNAELEQRVADRTAELDAVNQELEAFAYSVSHDLRAPLRHVSGFAALLEQRTDGRLDEKSQHYVERISASVGEMGVLIDDLLQFSRTGRAELRLETVDMDALVAEVLPPLAAEAGDREIDWSIGALPSAVGDRALLRQVWANLLGNAVKYTRGRQPARIEVGVDGGDERSLVYFVRDNGVGFDMDYAHKLFGVFQRLHSTREFEGTGIGLANVHRIVTRLGGRVWAEGKVDEGAVFFFALPRRKEI